MKNHIFAGCLVGGALGDALGYSLIQDSSELVLSDVTQLALFTIEGLLWSDLRKKRFGKASYASSCFFSYQRWLSTQGKKLGDPDYAWVLDDKRFEIRSGLRQAKELNHVRSTDSSMADILSGIVNQDYGTKETPINSRKDDSVLTMGVPIGLYFMDQPKQAFEVASDIAVMTHGHPSAYLSCGLYAAIISFVASGSDLGEAVYHALSLLGGYHGSYEVSSAVLEALEQAKKHDEFELDMDKKSAAYTLAYGLYCAVQCEADFEEAVILAIQGKHKKEMGAVCGSLIGAVQGLSGVPEDAVSYLEGKDIIIKMANQLEACSENDN